MIASYKRIFWKFEKKAQSRKGKNFISSWLKHIARRNIVDRLTRNLLTVGVLALIFGANIAGGDAPPIAGTLMMVWMFYLGSTAPKAGQAPDA